MNEGLREQEKPIFVASNLIKDTRKYLKSELKLLNGVNFQTKLTEFGYSHKQITVKRHETANLTEFNEKVGLYIFSESSNFLSEKIWKNHRLELRKSDRKVPSWHKNRMLNQSRVFYVGKSKNLKKRINNQVNENTSNSTYSLRLSSLKSLKYSMDIFWVDENNENIISVNNIVETRLHQLLLPVIGTKRS